MSSLNNPELNPNLFFDQNGPTNNLEALKNFKIYSKNLVVTFSLPCNDNNGGAFYYEESYLRKIMGHCLLKNNLKIVSFSYKSFKLPAICVSEDKSHKTSDFYTVYLSLDKPLATRNRFFFYLLLPHPNGVKNDYLVYPALQFFSGKFSKLPKASILGRIAYNESPVLPKINKNFRFSALNLRLTYCYSEVLGNLTKEIDLFLKKRLKNFGLVVPFSHLSRHNSNNYESIIILKLKRRLDTRDAGFFNLMGNDKDRIIGPKSWRVYVRYESFDMTV